MAERGRATAGVVAVIDETVIGCGGGLVVGWGGTRLDDMSAIEVRTHPVAL
jgi:hypothetical protein